MTRTSLAYPSQAPDLLDRIKVARLLRTIRASLADGSEAISTDIDWAHSMLPESRAVRRLKIHSLLTQGDTEAADVLVALGLLKHPTDSGLSFLSGKSLFLQNRYEEADRTIRLVLPRRAQHTETITLAGRIALKLGNHDRAVDLFQRANRHRPDRLDIIGWLIESLLASGGVEQAETLLRNVRTPPPLLKARILKAQDRRIEAIALLDATLSCETDDDLHDEQLTLLIELLENTGDRPRLERISSHIALESPKALIRLARSDLATGRFSSALDLLDSLPADRNCCASACEIRLVATAMLDRISEANLAYLDLERAGSTLDVRSLAECWNRGLQGRIILDQHCSASASTDPNPRLLTTLIRKALSTFKSAQADDSTPDDPRAEIQRHLAICQTALGDPLTPAFGTHLNQESTDHPSEAA